MSDEKVEQTCCRCGALNRIPAARLSDSPICGSCKQPLLPKEPVSATDASFSCEVEQAAVPVLVDFWAPWCGPCRMVGPVVAQLAAEHAGRLKVVKVNVDDNPSIAARFGISSIPALKIFRKGRVVDETLGAVPRSELQRLVAKHLDP